MKAWHVQDTQGEEQEIIFAETRGKAIVSSEAYSFEGDYTRVRATRAKYANDLENKADELIETMLQNGWWHECGGTNCSNQVEEHHDYVISMGSVYCEHCKDNLTK
ncbi:hypothetical protein [Oceanobacillus sojae]|uniref:hypothetical protein n=1 Tax=Oceanobacillus sojae TaxID=582851 RepID=UPI00362A0FFC